MPQLRSERGAVIAGPEQALLAGACRSGTSNAAFGKLKPGPGRSATEVARNQRARIHSAMLESVAQLGYDAITVRELAGLAGVSSRTFYQHYQSKEDCFWSVHQLIARRMLRGVGVAQACPPDRKGQLDRMIKAIVGEWARDPRAARVMLIDACMAGPDSPIRTRRVNRSLVAKAGVSLDSSAAASMPPTFLAEGIVAGLVGVVRSRLLSKQYDSLPDLDAALAQWGASFHDPVAIGLGELDLSIGCRVTKPSLSVSSSERGIGGVLAPNGDRTLLLSAASKLASVEDYENVTPQKVFTAAGISRRRFHENFAHVEDVFIAVMEMYMREALVCAERASEGSEPEESIRQVVSALCAQVAQVPAFARLCFGEMSGMRMPMMECRERFVAEIAKLIKEQVSSTATSGLAVEASIWALMGVLQGEVSMGRAAQVPRLAGCFAYLLLAPTLGASTAVSSLPSLVKATQGGEVHRG